MWGRGGRTVSSFMQEHSSGTKCLKGNFCTCKTLTKNIEVNTIQTELTRGSHTILYLRGSDSAFYLFIYYYYFLITSSCCRLTHHPELGITFQIFMKTSLPYDSSLISHLPNHYPLTPLAPLFTPLCTTRLVCTPIAFTTFHCTPH